MADRYLKLDPELAYQIKKDIKSSVESFYVISQKINAYKLLRKKEIVLKNKLKIALSQLKTKVDYMESTFPEEERKNVELTIMQQERQQRKLAQPKERIVHPVQHHVRQEPKKDVSQDLEEIRKNLERFKNS
jgi:hypothetical protein